MSPQSDFRVSPGFCLLAGWFGAVNGWRLLAEVLSAAALHELGHWLVLRLLGVRVTRLRLGVFGAVLETDSGRLSYGQELAAVLAGPGTNLLCALALTAAGPGLEEAAGAHLVLGAFNLLPVRPLDGGRALYLLTAWLFGPSVGERTARWSGTATALAMAIALGELMRRTGGSLWLLPPMAGMLAAAWREFVGKGTS
jgi:stage IV sporulation protein FB